MTCKPINVDVAIVKIFEVINKSLREDDVCLGCLSNAIVSNLVINIDPSLREEYLSQVLETIEDLEKRDAISPPVLHS